MKILGSDIRVGNIIEYKNDLWKCLKNQTSNRGNLRSHNQVELKSITKGTKLNERFRADETVELVTTDNTGKPKIIPEDLKVKLSSCI